MWSLQRFSPAVLPAVLAVFFVGTAQAGPPYVTDDPEPVEYKHWELYIGTLQHNSHEDGWSGTLPHVEVNYGVLPDVQLHAIAPAAYTKAHGEDFRYGYGDTELGVKYRFIHETDNFPQVGIFPLVELPTGDHDRGLGNGKTQVFVPVWLQKTFGAWQTYGGGGYWFNPGEDNKDYWFVGWQVQRKITEALSVGMEIFHEGPKTQDGRSDTAIDLGAVYDINENTHLMFSAGHTVQGPSAFIGYFALQFTWGPEEPKKPEK